MSAMHRSKNKLFSCLPEVYNKQKPSMLL